jgi:hypothetical protein
MSAPTSDGGIWSWWLPRRGTDRHDLVVVEVPPLGSAAEQPPFRVGQRVRHAEVQAEPYATQACNDSVGVEVYLLGQLEDAPGATR